MLVKTEALALHNERRSENGIRISFLNFLFFSFFHDSFEMLFKDEFPFVLMVSVDRLVSQSLLQKKNRFGFVDWSILLR